MLVRRRRARRASARKHQQAGTLPVHGLHTESKKDCRDALVMRVYVTCMAVDNAVGVACSAGKYG